MTQYDYLAYFSRAQVIGTVAAKEATKCIDLEATTPQRQIGVGKPLYVEVYATATDDQSAQTLVIALQTSASLIVAGAGTALLTSAAIALPNTDSKLMWQIMIPTTGLLRYLGLVYDGSAGMSTTTVSVTAFICETPSAFTQYDSALIVAG
jgi:hypothetical protein